MNKFIDKLNQSNEQKLRNMHTKHPKEYWKFLNSIKSNENLKSLTLVRFMNILKRLVPLSIIRKKTVK